jgi:hypothetical protein
MQRTMLGVPFFPCFTGTCTRPNAQLSTPPRAVQESAA